MDKPEKNNIQSFWDRFRKTGSPTILKADSDAFFILKLENLAQHAELPISIIEMKGNTCLFVTGGEISLAVGSIPRKIIKGECIIIPAGRVFSFKDFAGVTGYIWTFQGPFTNEKYGQNQLLNDFEIWNSWSGPKKSPGFKNLKYTDEITKQMYLDYSENGLKNAVTIQSHLMVELLESDKHNDPEYQNERSRYKELTKKFMQQLHQNFRTKQLVSDYASLLDITPNHLNKLVKQTTGKSPTKWIDEAVLAEAKKLLYHSNQTVPEIASEIGLSGASYLRILFKKYTDLTPEEFREKIIRI